MKASPVSTITTDRDSDKPVTYAADPRQLPAALAPLRVLRNYVVWKWEKNAKGKWTKPPYQPRKPEYKASNNDRKTWGTFDQACRAVESGKADGIGLVLLGTDVCAFDIDDCRDPSTRRIDPVALDLVKRANSYTEVTVSGTGLRVIGHGSKRPVHTKQAMNGSGVSVESYRNCERYITLSGMQIDKRHKSLRDIDTLIDEVVEELGGAPQQASSLNVAIEPVNDTALDFYESSLPDKLRNKIENGDDEISDRSTAFFKVVKELKDRGISLPVIIGLFKRYPDGIAAKYSEDGRMEKETIRVYGKPDTPPPEKTKTEDIGTTEAKAKRTLIETSEEFTSTFTPPDYLLDGVCLRGFMYSMTAPTGHGKTSVAMALAMTVALGREFAGLEVSQGKVLYLAGENPDDVRMRWIAMAEHKAFDSDLIDVHFVAGSFDIGEMEKKITKEVTALGGVVLVIIDTGPSFFMGDNENDNTDMLGHAKMMRRLVNLPGNPTVIAAMHPTKNATKDALLPRGGGAFLAEVDGNLTCWRDDMLVTLHWAGKHRGVDFEPLMFELQPVTARRLIDSRGRHIPTVIANELSKEDQRARVSDVRQEEDSILMLLHQNKGTFSYAEIASEMDWYVGADKRPNKVKVQRLMKRLTASKLVDVDRDGVVLTKKGEKAAENAAAERGAHRG